MSVHLAQCLGLKAFVRCKYLCENNDKIVVLCEICGVYQDAIIIRAVERQLKGRRNCMLLVCHRENEILENEGS